ncbi:MULTISPECIES: FecCD family ABC transporter permease [Geobacillus]|jgi:iron complex transport system permease protein|uniref:FecCD family ABC transporter permease n=1 Tax=Geobacillus TaxID=129337 RepID=UPI0004133C47|nr:MULTISPECIES: iron ABC transporter permease [Geobacillus]ARA98001.1 ferrichrome ABC transporter permease [Geobacillus thermodenitrificans]ARP41201.1 Iron(3+)-hydroxamate import system permease protein FhuB [Geobacillus thermodenitrificans]ATO37356.1 ferrichrome ABC transporter permease [Geobacillus thermodenitrificans]KQB94816.1 Iron-uptake system permease protein FeuB [Geobacillus sp. PA-3]MED0664537.1 iron ABC transporter permease [Geobacillus thermodenitrificans]
MQLRISPSALILWLSPVAMVLIIIASILYGVKNIDEVTVWKAIFDFDPNDVNHQIVRHSRLPRVIGALLIGAFLAISGAIMQGMTRNYLASPSIMGVSDGSVFTITLCMIIQPGASSLEMIMYSLVGSAVAVGFVFWMASILPNGMSPVRMAIIGMIIGTFLSSISAALSSYFQVSQNVSFWYNARLHQMDPNFIKLAVPFAIVGLTIALMVSKSITILSLGEEISVSLGQKTMVIKALAIASVVILTGISVALAGNIGFVGLIIPHMTRFLVGVDYRRIIPCAGVLGAIFLALSDILSRFLNYPFETPIGVVTALIGVPFFLYLIYTRGGGKGA